MEWSIHNVYSTLHICWGAQAGLYYHYGLKKHKLDSKIFGVFKHEITKQNVSLLSGFDDEFYVPQSMYTEIRKVDINKIKELHILSESKKSGVYIVSAKKGLNINIPDNYFPNDDPSKPPIVKWRGHSNLLSSNWLNYYVYQETPYNLVHFD